MASDEPRRISDRTRRSWHACLRWIAVGLVGSGVASAADSGASVPACIEYWGEARFRGYGYYHIVHVANGCERAAACDVSTNVNPTPEHVEIPAQSRVEVVTFQGSPAREFVPVVDCKLL